MKPTCRLCQTKFSLARREAGYLTCKPCGERTARQVQHTIVPLNKSNYIHVSDASLLRGLNPKFTSSF